MIASSNLICILNAQCLPEVPEDGSDYGEEPGRADTTRRRAIAKKNGDSYGIRLPLVGAFLLRLEDVGG